MPTLKGLVVVAGALTLGACRTEPGPPAQANAPIHVREGVVAEVDWPSAIEAGGTVRAALNAAVAARIVAPVAAVHVSAGDRVRRGQPLVTLDARELQARVEGAAAGAVAARQTVTSAAAHEAAADAALALARATHDRLRMLHEMRSATAQELDAAVAGLAGAAAQRDAARAQAVAAGAALEAAQAATDAARIGLSYAVLTAPFDGVVSSRMVDPGSLAAPGVPLLMVESAGGYRLEAPVDESRRTMTEPGDPVEVSIDSLSSAVRWVPARVFEIGAIDARQHSFLIKVDLPAMAALHSGAFGRVRLFGPTRRTLAVPGAALLRRGQLWLAFVIDTQGIARLRAMTPGESRKDAIEVLAGLAAGDRVVLNPAPDLVDGARVATGTGTATTSASSGADR